jgi:hypothetical protein
MSLAPGKYDAYRYFCSTEGKWIDETLQSGPTKCKNGDDHIIKQDSVMIIKKDIFKVQPIKNFSNDYSTNLDINDSNTQTLLDVLKRLSLLEQCANKRGLLDFV